MPNVIKPTEGSLGSLGGMQISVPSTRFHWHGAGKFPSSHLFAAFSSLRKMPTDVYTQF